MEVNVTVTTCDTTIRVSLRTLQSRRHHLRALWSPNRFHCCGPGGNDVVDDVLGIPSYTAQQRRAERVEEGKTHEVETGTGLDDAPIVHGKTVVGR